MAGTRLIEEEWFGENFLRKYKSRTPVSPLLAYSQGKLAGLTGLTSESTISKTPTVVFS
jgi:hypothetical protein